MFTLLSYLAIVGRLHLALVPLLLAAGTAMVWVRVKGGTNIWQMRWQQSDRQRRIIYMSDLVSGRHAAHEIRLFGLARHLIDAWERLTRQTRNEQIKEGMRNEAAFFAASQLPHGVLALGIWLLLKGFAGRVLTIGDYVLIVGAIQGAQGLLNGFTYQIGLIHENLLACGDTYDFMRLQDEPVPTQGAPFPPFQEGILLENVSFAYPGSDREVLSGMNLVIRPGEKLALVGENGAGKTTLVKLLLGLYQPTAGRITIDGIPLMEVDPNARRQAMAAVFQDFARFELSARENIGFGRLDALFDDESLLKAAGQGGARELIERLPQGLDTVLGRTLGETDLSGGEWQRLAISRAFARDARILVLDEPTASLDPLAEAEVYQRFAELAAGRTVLLISHRLGSARLADRIVVLGGGRVAEEGTHQSLMAKGGIYAEMFGVQAQWYARQDEGNAPKERPGGRPEPSFVPQGEVRPGA